MLFWGVAASFFNLGSSHTVTEDGYGWDGFGIRARIEDKCFLGVKDFGNK